QPARRRRPGRGALLTRAADRRRCPEPDPAARRARAPAQRFSKIPRVLSLFSATFPPPQPPVATWFPRLWEFTHSGQVSQDVLDTYREEVSTWVWSATSFWWAALPTMRTL